MADKLTLQTIAAVSHEMLRIEIHIESLLLSHECVIIPGVGGFVTRYEKPFLSEDGKEIFPPYRSVSFNSQLRANDGLLTQSYMTAYDTSYPKALSLVDEDVKALKDKISVDGYCHIGSIGTLQSTQNNALLFTPDTESGFYSKDLYGLGQCKLNEAVTQLGIAATPAQDPSPSIGGEAEQSATNTQQQSDHLDSTPVGQKEVSSLRQNGDVEPNTALKAQDDSHFVIRISKSALRNTVATIAAAMLYFIFAIAPSSSPLVSPRVKEASVVSSVQSGGENKVKGLARTGKKTDSTQPANNNDSINNNVSPTAKNVGNAGGQQGSALTNSDLGDIQAKQTGKVATAVNSAGKETASGFETATKNNYTLVLASEVTLKGANNLVHDMNKAGFSDAQVIRDRRMIRVIYSSYSNSHSAYTALKKLRAASPYFQTAWVMKR